MERDDIAKRTAHCADRTDATVLQPAVVRPLGCRRLAEQSSGMELAFEQREWVHVCEPLSAFAYEDGIVCVPSVRGEPPAGKPLQARLAAAHGETLDDWLCRRFFEQHCRLFHNRPFIWHIWDGRKRDGFHAPVNYHKLAATVIDQKQ